MSNSALWKIVDQLDYYICIILIHLYLAINALTLLLRKVEAVNSESHIENGLPPKEEEDETGQKVRDLAARVVDEVVKRASEAAQQRTTPTHAPLTRSSRGCGLQKLPTIQIDTVASPPPSPVDLTPPDEANEVEPIDESEVQLDLDTEEQSSDNTSDEVKEFLKSYVEDILSQAMVLAEKKLQFAGLPVEDEEEDEEPPPEPVPPPPEPAKEPEVDEAEVRATAEKVVHEVIEKASETAAERLESSLGDLNYPDLPSITIDTVKSAPPSPDLEEEVKYPNKKWTFTMDADDSDSEKNLKLEEKKKKNLIKFDEAPEDVKDAAESFVKEIVGRAVAMAEEKCVPTVPFNFEDVDLMKTTGPWYIRAREALIRLLRTACFCTPRRSDS